MLRIRNLAQSLLTTQYVPFSPTVGLMSAGQLGVYPWNGAGVHGALYPVALFTCFIRKLETDAAAGQQMPLYSCSPSSVVITLQSEKRGTQEKILSMCIISK